MLVEEHASEHGEWELPDGIVLVSGDGHCWIALGYREAGDAAVTWFDADAETELRLTPTFEGFLAGSEVTSCPSNAC